MTRKKIDLALATPEWLKEKLGHRHDWYLGGVLAREDGPDKEEALHKERLKWFLGDALNITVDQIGNATARWGVDFTTSSSFAAKDLNRLMNSEIHLEGKVFVFDSLDAAGHMEGDTYMGEYNEYPVHRIEVRYRSKVERSTNYAANQRAGTPICKSRL
jgi:hypothetical protein